jgi:monovalent cation/proton antiporter MnhG/PhaG subunit
MAEWIMAALVMLGGFFCFVAGLGVLRLPDVLIRMHASTKAGTLGAGLILVAVAIYFADAATITRAIAAILFLLADRAGCGPHDRPRGVPRRHSPVAHEDRGRAPRTSCVARRLRSARRRGCHRV